MLIISPINFLSKEAALFVQTSPVITVSLSCLSRFKWEGLSPKTLTNRTNEASPSNPLCFDTFSLPLNSHGDFLAFISNLLQLGLPTCLLFYAWNTTRLDPSKFIPWSSWQALSASSFKCNITKAKGELESLFTFLEINISIISPNWPKRLCS